MLTVRCESTEKFGLTVRMAFSHIAGINAQREPGMEYSPIALKKSARLDRCSIVPNSVVFGMDAPNDRARFVAFGTGKSLLLAVCALEKLDFQCRCWYTICSPQQRHSTGRSPSHHEGVF